MSGSAKREELRLLDVTDLRARLKQVETVEDIYLSTETEAEESRAGVVEGGQREGRAVRGRDVRGWPPSSASFSSSVIAGAAT